MSIGTIQIQGSVAREIDRMVGRLPALDRAIQARFPAAQHAIGRVMTRFARENVQVREGELRSGIGYSVSQGLLTFFVKGVEHAAAVEFGYKGRELVKAHERRISSVFGRVLSDPRSIRIGTFVRDQKKPARPFFFRAYFDSFRAMFGILYKNIEEAQAEVGFNG